MKIKRSQISKFLRENSEGHIFSAVFEYKDNATNRKLGRVGKDREMLCRLGVKSYTKGVVKPEDRRKEDDNNQVLTVYDMTKWKEGQTEEQAYRRINIAGLKSLKINGIKYEVTDD